MKTVSQIIQGKGGDIFSVSPDMMVIEALRVMAEKEIGAVLVMDEGAVIGVFSERDYSRKVILHEKSSLKTPIREVMRERVVYVRPDYSIEQCMALMTDKHIRHLPVLDGDDLIGLVSIGDLVKASIEAKDFLIEQLENYISGNLG